MSGVLKSIGKVFKKVVHVVKKVALPALAIGAVVLTGGAALGVLPAVGSVIGGLGLGAGVTSALTGAVTMAGWGGLAGGIMGGKKGLMKGALYGGLLGAAGGAAGLIGGAGTAATGAEAASTVAGGAAPEAAGLIGSDAGAAALASGAAPAAAAAAPAIAAPAAAAAGGGSSLVTGLLNSPIIGNVISGLGQGAAAKAANKADAKKFAANYNIADGPLTTGLLSQYQNPSTGTQPGADAFGQVGQWTYDERLGRLVRKT